MSNQEIEYQLSPPNQWFETLNKFLPSKIDGAKFILEEKFGNGKLHYLTAQEGLWAQELEFTLNKDLTLYRTAKNTNDFFVIDFYLSDTEMIQSLEGNSYSLSFENVNLVLTSSVTNSKTEIPKNKKITIFNILFSREWLFKNVIIDHENSRAFFESNNPIYLSENLDFRLKELLKQIDFNKNNKLVSESIIIQIINYLFDRFDNRELAINKNNIHHDDLNQLLKVREFLDANPEKDILIENLSYAAGMSLSKFKRLFKLLFGNTPYQYHLQNKMEKAMEILSQKKYSISETGFLMGYSNLSQFSKAFRNHFGILPSEVILKPTVI